jgi:ubiquinone/menaquinone biosynthesis C-methylase UbiE
MQDRQQSVAVAAEYFDTTSQNYDADFSESSIWAIAHNTGRAILEAALKDRTQLAVADIGCGTGKWAGFVARRTARLLLSDVSGAMLMAAAQKFAHIGSVETLQASVDDLGVIPDASFDLVLCMGDPLSYVPDYKAGVAQLCRIAKPGALIFVSVDSRLGYLRILKERHKADLLAIFQFLETGNIVGWEGLPLHAFTSEELKSLFALSACRTISVDTLPSLSAYFLFDDNFRAQLRDPEVFQRLTMFEQTFRCEGSPGPHHLYGLFEKEGLTVR